MRPITDLVVHCSATPGGKVFRAADIDRWHREKGWAGIGYHFVIGLDGLREDGRAIEYPGAHVEGHNKSTIGICLIGGVGADGQPEATFTDAQYDALETLLLELRERFPHARIRGHRDFKGVKKACPSFDVTTWCNDRGLLA